MADISIRRAHALSRDQALATGQELAAEIGRAYGLRHRWDGAILRFEGAGLSGDIEFGDNEIVVDARLGLLLSGLRATIEGAINDKLDELLG